MISSFSEKADRHRESSHADQIQVNRHVRLLHSKARSFRSVNKAELANCGLSLLPCCYQILIGRADNHVYAVSRYLQKVDGGWQTDGPLQHGLLWQFSSRETALGESSQWHISGTRFGSESTSSAVAESQNQRETSVSALKSRGNSLSQRAACE
jgi:hypothetical protein